MLLLLMTLSSAWGLTSPMRDLRPVLPQLTTAAVFATAPAALAADAVELAELPPPYVPVLVGLGLLVGVGVLTSSLGNVMDEEASLGMQSGARAKKEIERSRSSYFKKK
ncbi:hypothetical protein FisN_12Hh043 [Fistulifera solaris]|uniref:Uncharacterized protein n=1 Tax=Fistulifera solaris TaxID=1519565 RepID=A0A1Z5K2E8_FISSO|nr:hypothetical protein FisN_12Hh043 [Fistulifera solaris]|eukprot:GAX20198.1 hypothetical protein FisN_12Hh043 [Fistulifera solaris]